MTLTSWTWLVLALLYCAFFGWYTSFGGPLTPDEVEHYVEQMRQINTEGSDETRAILREFLESDTGDDFVMWNNLHMHDTPLQGEGVEPGETSDEVMAKYMEYMLPAMLARASHPVIFGQAAGRAPEMFGLDGVRRWSSAGGVRYRSRRDLMEIATNPQFRGAHHFKVAAIEKTFAFPIDPWLQLGDPRLVLGLAFLVVGLGVQSLRRT